ncbi:DUSP11 [Branchiostoma lanceolatum]|uniref:DUSP11 protein n=1 Tax=Branchiostoma lanceolatum TaxID=7740 RepID=A0A8J9ZLD9_BRALA|nr:DUSP11 [Branchiostoma lanceolatum]
MPPRSIPDRWLDYSPMGRQMEGTRFISFKVPLKMGICSNLPSEDRFTIPDMIQHISDQGARLGIVIDLTFTTRYYNKQDIAEAGIKYEKIFTAGKEVPSDDVVQEYLIDYKGFTAEKAIAEYKVGRLCLPSYHCLENKDQQGEGTDRHLESGVTLPTTNGEGTGIAQEVLTTSAVFLRGLPLDRNSPVHPVCTPLWAGR